MVLPFQWVKCLRSVIKTNSHFWKVCLHIFLHPKTQEGLFSREPEFRLKLKKILASKKPLMPGENVGKSISNLIDGSANYTNTHTLSNTHTRTHRLSSSPSFQVHANKRSRSRTAFFLCLISWTETVQRRGLGKKGCERELNLQLMHQQL